MKKFILAIIILFSVVFFITRAAELQTIYETIQQADWRYILLAILVQGIWVLNFAASAYMIHRALGLTVQYRRIALLTGAATFVNVVMPSAGMGGIGIFINEAKQRKYSVIRVMVASGVFALLEYLGFAIVLIVGLVILFERNNLNAPEVLATVILLVAIGILAYMIYLGMFSPQRMGEFLAGLARLANRLLKPFIHREYFDERRAHLFAYEAGSGLKLLRKQPRNLILPAVLALSNKFLLMLILFLVFLAFNVPITFGTLVAGFSIGNLFNIVSPTPAGIGIVEGALALVLTSMHVPLAAATVVALVYRGIVFWLPLFYGIITFRLVMRPTQPRSSKLLHRAPALNEQLPD
ncbi:MAG: putative rane protein [Chloroflexi bacterium]|nr:putative rane protein [Chloroflexota bacterium]